MKYSFVLLALVLIAGELAAQVQPSPPCRDVASVDDIDIELSRPLFYDDDVPGDTVLTGLRAYFGIQQLTPADSVIAIRDVAECEEWLPAISAALQSRFGSGDTSGYLFRMIQFGPYMVVTGLIDPETVPAGTSIGDTLVPELIFEVDGKRFLGLMWG